MLLSALSGSSHYSLWWLGASWAPFFLGLPRRCCHLPSGLPGGWAKFAIAQSPHIRSEALSRVRAVAIRRSLGSSPLCQWSSPPLRSSAPSPLCLSYLPLPLAPMGVVEWLIDLPTNPQPMQEHR